MRAGGEPLPRLLRRRAREEILREIVDVARRQLSTQGAAALSLRAVARELGMVSSAIYRYVPSRDDLLTLLILDAYNALGASVEAAEALVAREDLLGRWSAVCHAVRDWALDHPQEYALVYGSPVPGYQAPQTTVAAATRVTALLSKLLQDAVAADPALASLAEPMGGDVAVALRPTRPFVPDDVPNELLLRGLVAWTDLFGAVSMELFGHWHMVIDDDPQRRRAFFAEVMTRKGRHLGLV